jgi:hypothetical protein
VPRIVYAPGAPEITTQGEFNLWPGWGCKPEKGDASPFDQLLKFLTKDEPDILPWIYEWLAYPLQHPGTKMFTSLVVWGTAQGTGKTLLGETMRRIYGENFIEIGNDALYSRFNNWASERQLIMATEISSKGQRAAADRLKTLITQTNANIEKKYCDPISVVDCNNYYFTSNHPDALFLEDRDRRFVIVEVVGDPLPKEFYDNYDTWLKTGGASFLFHKLLHYPLNGFKPTDHAPTTRAKRDMVAAGRSDVAQWVAQLRETPDSVLRLHGKPVTGSLFTTTELYRIFFTARDGRTQVTLPGLGRELKAGGLPRVNKGHPVHGRKGQTSHPDLWAVRSREVVMNMTQPELHALYTKELSERNAATPSINF